jgi:PPOX class probable F420-dependent enzyme
VTEDEARKRFAEARVARLATVDHSTGKPHLVPICFALEGDTIYSAVDQKPKSTPDLKRLRNIASHPQVSLIVDHYEDDWAKVWWVRVDGTAHVTDDGPEREEGLVRLAEKYDQYRDAADLLGRMVVIRATRWLSWAYTDLG